MTTSMSRLVSLVFICLLTRQMTSACTTFFINKSGELIFGRNYDWITDAGMLNSNLRGLSKTSMKTADGETISWTSQYGSLTFNQYGKEFPTGGMNEKGLVVELMWLDGTKYPASDDRPAIGVLQWIQYQLDNCSTIEEVIATDKKLRIASINTSPLHYLVADANGQVATIEFLDGKMVVHRGAGLPFPVLTNNKYDESVNAYKNSTSRGDNSLERFGTACKMIQQIDAGSLTKPLKEFAFDILAKVAQGNFTKWSIVYDLKNKSIQFRTNRFVQVKSLNFSDFDFRCGAAPRAIDINQDLSGDIYKSFRDFNPSDNSRIIETAVTESRPNISISKESQDALSQYPRKVTCQVTTN